MEKSADESDASEVSEQSVTSTESSLSARPGRFTGAQSTWRALTHEDRLVVTSLTRLRDQNLSIHLFNAHDMKRRLYIPGIISNRTLNAWAHKDRWRQNAGAEAVKESEKFVPPKSWTAWPLPADVVPRPAVHTGPVDDDDAYTFHRQVPSRPSLELEEILISTTLRFAKRRLTSGELEPPHLEVLRKKNDRSKTIARSTEGKVTTLVDESISNRSQGLQIIGETDIKIQGFENDIHFRSSNNTGPIFGTARSENIGFLKESSMDVPNKNVEFQQALVSADDDRSREILRPTIHHTLSKLDELLMALHHTRQICVHSGSDQTDSQSDFEEMSEKDEASDAYVSGEPEPSKSARKRGRPSKVLEIPFEDENRISESDGAPKMTRRGRPKKIYIPLHGETHNEMLVRLAKSNKKKLPFQSTSSSRVSSTHSKASPKRKIESSTGKYNPKRLRRLGIRDWSEVMGCAALIGLPSDVVSRATQRCATIFGEGMAIQSLIQNPPTEWEKDKRIVYVPEAVPDLGDDNLGELHQDERSAKRKASAPNLRKRNARSRSVKAEGDESGPESSKIPEREENFWCSYQHCPRHAEGFSKKWHLTSHLTNAHKLSGDELEKTLEDSDDEMLGGVHVDRYMKDVKARQGWRGHDSVKRTRSHSRSKSRDLNPLNNASDTR